MKKILNIVKNEIDNFISDFISNLRLFFSLLTYVDYIFFLSVICFNIFFGFHQLGSVLINVIFLFNWYINLLSDSKSIDKVKNHNNGCYR